MTPHDADDQLLKNLARLRPLTPDPIRTARVRAQCRARLERLHRRSEHTTMTAGFGTRVLAPAVVLGLCALYAASLVSTAVQLRSLF